MFCVGPHALPMLQHIIVNAWIKKKKKERERERERVKTKNKTKKFDYLKKNLLVGFVNNPYEFQRTRFFLIYFLT